ncbi:Surfactin synthase subunit 1 [compost metagenome]
MKVRGYRIELGEIESRLKELHYVNQAIVCSQKDHVGDAQLVAYIVTDNVNYIVDAKMELEKTLPKYMVPTVLNRVPYIPLTPSGKADQNKLKELVLPEQPINNLIIPSNHHEKIVSDVYQKVLLRNDISVLDNFFDIGGSSIKAIQAVEYLYEKYRIKIEVLTVFQFPNIRTLAEHLRGKQSNNVETSRQYNDHLQGKKAINRLRKNVSSKEEHHGK